MFFSRKMFEVEGIGYIKEMRIMSIVFGFFSIALGLFLIVKFYC